MTAITNYQSAGSIKMWPMMTASQLTCWRGPLLVHGNYKSSLFYFCVYVTKETVHPSQHFRSELPNSCNIFHQCNLGIMKPDSLFFSDYCETKWNPPWYTIPSTNLLHKFSSACCCILQYPTGTHGLHLKSTDSMPCRRVISHYPLV